MFIDANSLRSGTGLSADVCIIGAGPAGLTLAHELIGTNADVILVESGGHGPDDAVQFLNQGPVTGDSYAGLRATRHRQIGGSTNLWNTPVGSLVGAKCVPLDPWDFTAPATGEAAGWPIEYADLAPHYVRAQSLCGLGPFDYEAPAWQGASLRPFEFHSEHLISRVYQFGSRDRIVGTQVDAVCDASNIRVYGNLTVGALATPAGRTLSQARAFNGRAEAIGIRATIFVLAAGAVENARILLTSGQQCSLLDSVEPWLGRGFMEHPRDGALLFVPKDRHGFMNAAFYDTCMHSDGTTVCGRIACAGAHSVAAGLPNFSVTLLPHGRPEGFVQRALRRLGLRQVKRGHGWSALPDPTRYFDGFRLRINLEQRPDPANRITLSSERDALGLPRPQLHWTWGQEEQARLLRLRALLAAEFRSAGLGSVEAVGDAALDPNGCHHAGTTRMSVSPRFGVVDRDGRVHGIDNVYVTGASVFPTTGYANPTLTIVAMASRLAACLAGRLWSNDVIEQSRQVA